MNEGVGWVFPGDRGSGKPMSNNTILKGLERMGYKGRMTGHGFRGLASTILHEQGYTHEPTLVGDLTAAYLHIPIYRTPQNSGTDFSFIIPGLGPQVIQGAPQINISSITSVSEAGSRVLGQDI